MRRILFAVSLLIALSFLLATGLQAQGAKPVPPAKPTPDQSLGLSKTSVFDVPAPPKFKDEDSSPGEKPVLKRINREFPPMIPHGIADLLPITRASNLCLDCHDTQAKRKAGEPTPIPASHYVDLRRAPEGKGAKPAGTRHYCTACHVPQTDAKPLVGSAYRP